MFALVLLIKTLIVKLYYTRVSNSDSATPTAESHASVKGSEAVIQQGKGRDFTSGLK